MAEDTKNAAQEEEREADKQEGSAAPEAETAAETQPETQEEVRALVAAPYVLVIYTKTAGVTRGWVVRFHHKNKHTTPKGEERERLQVFEGTVIAVKGQDAQSRTITVRKVTGGIGVERIFPVKSPVIAKIEVLKQLRVRRAKLYFMRDHKKKIKEAAKK